MVAVAVGLAAVEQADCEKKSLPSMNEQLDAQPQNQLQRPFLER